MTAQIGDLFHYGNSEYDLAESSDFLPFSPKHYGLVPADIDSDCLRGYFCEYVIADERLYLEMLYINAEDGSYPEINGVKASLTDGMKPWQTGGGYHIYTGLHIPVDFSGELLLGAQLEKEYATGLFMGPAPWSYKSLISLSFRDGRVLKTEDHSALAEEIRKAISDQKRILYRPDEREKLRAKGFRAWWLEEQTAKREKMNRFIEELAERQRNR